MLRPTGLDGVYDCDGCGGHFLLILARITIRLPSMLTEHADGRPAVQAWGEWPYRHRLCPFPLIVLSCAHGHIIGCHGWFRRGRHALGQRHSTAFSDEKALLECKTAA